MKTITRRAIVPLAALAATGLATGTASAATVTFDGATIGVAIGTGYAEDGMIVTDATSVSVDGQGEAILAVGSDLTLARADGSAFDLMSFDAAAVLATGTSLAVGWVTAAGEAGSATFTPGMATELATQALGVADLASVTFSVLGGGALRLDDVVVSDAAALPTPLPAAALLFGPAALALYGARRGR